MDAWIFAPILPILGFSAVRMTDIRTRHPKKTRKWMDGSSGIKNMDGHGLHLGILWPLLHGTALGLDYRDWYHLWTPQAGFGVDY